MGVNEAVAAAYRNEWGQVVATLIGLTQDWDLAEDCAQDAFARALARWPVRPRVHGVVAVPLFGTDATVSRTAAWSSG